MSYGFPQDIDVVMSYLGIGKEAVLHENDRFAVYYI